MRRSPARASVLLAALVLAAPPAMGQERAHGGGSRSEVLLRLDCFSKISRQEVTLFANGTVRLRERLEPQSQVEISDLGLPTEEDAGRLRLYLGELAPAQLEAYLERLRDENLAESRESAEDSVFGAWVETCRMELRIPGRPARDLTFGRYDSLSLATSRVLRIARELMQEVERTERIDPPFPPGYVPRVGDVLERVDGFLFEVVRYTDDGGGVELEGLRQPVTIYISRDNLEVEFTRLLRRDDGLGP